MTDSTGHSDEYVLGTDAEELARLGIQHRLWADSAHALWKRGGIGRGSRVLDVGCGPGYAARDIAQLIGQSGRLIGVDASPGFVAEFSRLADANGLGWIEARRGDVHAIDEVVADAGPFDAAYARWVFCFLPEPERVVEGLARVVRPGGRVCISDYFNYDRMTIAPRDPAFTLGIDAVSQAWRDSGGDPDVMGSLPGLFRRHGFEVERLDVCQHLARPSDVMWTWPDVFWPSFIPRIVKSGHLTQDQADAFMAAWKRASEDPDAFFLLPPIFDLVVRRD